VLRFLGFCYCLCFPCLVLYVLYGEMIMKLTAIRITNHPPSKASMFDTAGWVMRPVKIS